MPTLRLVATLALLAAVAHAADRPGLRARKPLLPSAPLAHTAPSTDLIAGKAMPEPAAPLTKGYLAVLGGVMIHLVCGSLYCWGNLVTYMPASLKYWSPEGGEGPSDAGLVLAFTLLSQMCGMPFGPLFESLVGPRLTALLGGAMMASGLWLASSATTLTQFVLSYAVLFGLGIGLSYQMPFITGGRWFPGKKGSVQGVVMTGLGSSAFFFNMLCTHLLNPQKVNAVGGTFPPEVYARWPGVLRRLSLCYAALALTGAALQSNPSALGKTCTQPRTRAPRNALRRRLRSSPTQIWMLGTSPTSQIWMHVSHVPRSRLPPADHRLHASAHHGARLLPADPILEFFKRMGRAPPKPSPKPQAHATLPPAPAAPALARGSSGSSGSSRPRGSGGGGDGGGERASVRADAELAWLRWLRTSGAGQFYGADTATPARRCPLPAPPAPPANVSLPNLEANVSFALIWNLCAFLTPPTPPAPLATPCHPPSGRTALASPCRVSHPNGPRPRRRRAALSCRTRPRRRRAAPSCRTCAPGASLSSG